MKKLEELQQEIIQLMAMIADKKNNEAAVAKIENIRLELHDALDFAEYDEELVRIGKFLKIVEELEGKL